jgi:hypothetical protein
MARVVGDLWPAASGTSSLGVDQAGEPDSGFTNEIRPFNHVHLNSGVVYDPKYGTSGVIRYGISSPNNLHGFELSFNGGSSYPIFVGGNETSRLDDVVINAVDDVHLSADNNISRS